ncbi:uncharacterized protein DS421_5g157420 [Arachis hypogaea]|nr:uncharacterized protein DS421_5g157420 [Arachis hypogaea]
MSVILRLQHIETLWLRGSASLSLALESGSLVAALPLPFAASSLVCLRMRKLMMLQKTRMIKLSHYYNIIRDRLNSGCVFMCRDLDQYKLPMFCLFRTFDFYCFEFDFF